MKLPRHLRLAYLCERALRRLQKAKNVKQALKRHSQLVERYKLDNRQENLSAFMVNSKLIEKQGKYGNA